LVNGRTISPSSVNSNAAPAKSPVSKLRVASSESCCQREGFSNAIGRPKKRSEKAPGRARRGPKYASPGGFSAQ
jgi:hypothetical protein